jgi:YVTN family beta-propeller protein
MGGTPMGIVLSPDERLLYVTNRDGNALVVVDTAHDAIIGTIAMPGAPARVAIVPGTSLLVVTLIEAGDVALVDVAGAKVMQRLHVGERAEGLFVDPRGRFATVAVQAQNKVVKIALPGVRNVLEFSTAVRPDPMLLAPAGLSLGRGKN